MRPGRTGALAALAAATLATAGAQARSQRTVDPETARSVDRMFAQLDTDRNGGISRAEGEAFIAGRKVSRANRERIWRALDRNRDGTVSRDELLAQAVRYQAQMQVR